MRVSIQHVALSDIVANPYRNIKSYRISKEKIDALIQSYDNSGFWDGSLQARPHPTKPGKVEIAFGHHRLEAAKRRKLSEVGLVVAKRSNEDMLRMMADENREEFKGDHLVQVETIAATIEAFWRGEIDLPPVAKDTPKSIIEVLPGGKTYTLGTVARFLGWFKPSDGQATNACRDAYAAYHERANIVPALQDMPEEHRTRQTTSAVLRATRTARALAKKAGRSSREVDEAAARAARQAVKQIKEGHIASRVKDEATKIGRAAARVDRTVPEINQFVHQRAEGIRARVVNLTDEINALLNELEPYRDQIDPGPLRDLIQALEFGESKLSGFFAKWIKSFTAVRVRNVTRKRPLLKGA